MVPGLDLQKFSKKTHKTAARARFALQNAQKLTTPEHFRTKCAPDCSQSLISHKNCKENWHGPRKVRTVDGAPIVVDLASLLLCGSAAGCDKTQWHGCAQQSMRDAATLLASGIAAGGC